MNISKTKIEGVYIVEPDLYGDDRGYFFESFNENKFNELTNADFHPVQDNESSSIKYVIRGLHFQNPPYAQAKLVRVVKGVVWDVAVDIRKNSPTYGQFVGVYLSGDNHKQFYLPKGMAHGFIALSDEVIFQYKCDNYYNKASEGAIMFDDPDINIDWNYAALVDTFKDIKDPKNKIDFILSDKDKQNLSFKDFLSNF